MTLLKVETADGLELDGVVGDTKGRPDFVVIHTHGQNGNFYANPFVAVMLDAYPKANIAFLSGNSRGHDGVAEASWAGEIRQVGGSIEDPGDSLLDLSAWHRFVEVNWPGVPIVLQAHSFGCDKVVNYVLRSRKEVSGVILLSPADSVAIRMSFPASPTGRSSWNSDQEIVLRLDLLRVGDYVVPISPRSFAKRAAFDGLFSVESTWLSNWTTETLALFGSADAMQVRSIRGWLDSSSLVVTDGIEGAGHQFVGYESRLVAMILAWLGSRTT